MYAYWSFIILQPWDVSSLIEVIGDRQYDGQSLSRSQVYRAKWPRSLNWLHKMNTSSWHRACTAYLISKVMNYYNYVLDLQWKSLDINLVCISEYSPIFTGHASIFFYFSETARQMNKMLSVINVIMIYRCYCKDFLWQILVVLYLNSTD